MLQDNFNLYCDMLRCAPTEKIVQDMFKGIDYPGSQYATAENHLDFLI